MARTISCIDVLTQAYKRITGQLTSEQLIDYSARGPYLLATFCTEAKELDTAYRKSKGLPDAPDFDEVELDPISRFPLSDRFVTAASAYIAAMLTIDENEALSDKLFDIYCDNMARIQSEIPAQIERIAKKHL